MLRLNCRKRAENWKIQTEAGLKLECVERALVWRLVNNLVEIRVFRGEICIVNIESIIVRNIIAIIYILNKL